MRPNVIIELKPYLHDYLYHEFGCRPTDEGVNVTAANDIDNKFNLSKIVYIMI